MFTSDMMNRRDGNWRTQDEMGVAQPMGPMTSQARFQAAIDLIVAFVIIEIWVWNFFDAAQGLYPLAASLGLAAIAWRGPLSGRVAP